MSTQMAKTFSFRWRSWLGLSVALFLLYGAFNVFLAITVPVSLHRGGAGAAGGALVLSPTADTALLGRSLAELDTADPRLGTFLVSFMDTMCAYMIAFGLLHLGVVWFALRRGQTWALWTVAIADLAIFPYFVAIVQAYAHFSVPPGDQSFLVAFAVVIIIATALGWFSLRQGPRSAAPLA